MKVSKKLSNLAAPQNLVIIFLVVVIIELFYIGTETQHSSLQPTPTQSAIYLTPEPSPTIKYITPDPSNGYETDNVIHKADLSNSALLSYTYFYKTNYQGGYGSNQLRGFSISYPANWDYVITTVGSKGYVDESRDTIVISSDNNKLIISQPSEGAGCYYPPEPTGGYGAYFTNYSDVRTIDGRTWRRSKIDSSTYIICQSDGNYFTDDNMLGAIAYKVPTDDPAIVSQMDDMVRSITLVK